MSDVVGAAIDTGAADWRIYQRNPDGTANVPLAGRWGTLEKDPRVHVRVVREDSSAPVAAHLGWRPAETRADGTWSATAERVPSGGPFRIETQLRTNAQPDPEWAAPGEVKRFVGVGELWVIAGQSNSAGFGKGPFEDGPELGVHVLANSMEWALASHPLNDSTRTRHPENREGANPAHSPWLAFAKRLKQELGCPVGLLQCSLGGSALQAWNPTEPGAHPLYETMRRVVEAAGGRARGILWYQGESDACPGAAETYLDRLSGMVRAWREALSLPDLAFVTCQLNRVLSAADERTNEAWSVVREAQRRAAREIEGVFVVPTLDCPLSDEIHNSPAGNVLIGERAARAALGGVYGRAVEHRAPEAVRGRAKNSGCIVEIEFANVTGNFRGTDPASVPFRVEDAQGVCLVEAVQYTGGPLVRLRLARALDGRAVVHGAWGGNPPPVPVDAPRFAPMLAFHRLEIE